MKIYSYIIFLGLLFCTKASFSQNMLEFNQIQQTKELLNPAFAGAKEGINLNFGFRQQWTGFPDAPQSFFISGYSPFGNTKIGKLTYSRNSLRVSNPEIYSRIYKSLLEKAKRKPKHVLGGFASNASKGHFQSWEAGMNYAFHFYINKKWKLSLGTMASFKNIDTDKDLNVRNPENDLIFQQYTNGVPERRLNLTLGVTAYTENFYFGYSAYNFANYTILDTELEKEKDLTHHTFMAGGNLEVHRNFSLKPEILAYYGMGNKELGYNLGLRGEYKTLGYVGVNWRNRKNAGMLLGLKITNKIMLHYAYELPIDELSEVSNSNGSHEAILGLSL